MPPVFFSSDYLSQRRGSITQDVSQRAKARRTPNSRTSKEKGWAFARSMEDWISAFAPGREKGRLQLLFVEPCPHDLSSGCIGLNSDYLRGGLMQTAKELARPDGEREVGVQPDGRLQAKRDAGFADVASVGVLREALSFCVFPPNQNLGMLSLACCNLIRPRHGKYLKTKATYADRFGISCLPD